jgi:hypothetical protein
MVKRAKLTLDHSEATDQNTAGTEGSRPKKKAKTDNTPSAAQIRSTHMSDIGKLLLLTGLAIASVVIFKRKIF